MDRITAMQVFMDVVETSSFTHSAQRLGMSRAMVTRYIATLEQWLDSRLFHRTTRKVSLTSAGEQCVLRCEALLKQCLSMEAESKSDKGEVKGHLRVATSVSFAHAALIPRVKSFMNKHPLVTIELDCGDRKVDLTDERIDLAIRITNHPESQLVARKLTNCQSVIVGRADYLAKMPKVEHPQQLNSLNCLHYSGFESSVWSMEKEGHKERVAIDVQFSTNEATVLLAAVKSGCGIAMLPRYLVEEQIERGELQQLIPQWQPSLLGIYALYPSRHYLAKPLREFLDYLVDSFAT